MAAPVTNRTIGNDRRQRLSKKIPPIPAALRLLVEVHALSGHANSDHMVVERLGGVNI